LFFPAGGRQVNAIASFFRYESGNAGGADESIRVRADGNDLGIYFPGDSIDLPIEARTWEIVPVTAICTGTIRLGVGRVQSARLVGTVRTIDSNRDDVIAQKAFTLTSSYGGTAALFAAIGVWNPAGSGRNAVVDEVGISSPALTSVQLGLISLVPANLDNGTNSKFLGGANSAPVMRAYQEYSAPNPPGFTRVYTWLNASNASKVFRRPLIVPPGMGLVAINQTAAQSLSVNIEWTNESI